LWSPGPGWAMARLDVAVAIAMTALKSFFFTMGVLLHAGSAVKEPRADRPVNELDQYC
jgi:hypothetical protein